MEDQELLRSLLNGPCSHFKKFGYNYYDKGPIGRVDGILIKNNKLEGGADKRGDDAAHGF